MSTQFHVHVLDDRDAVFLKLLREKLSDSINLTTGQIHGNMPDYQVLISGRPNKNALEHSQKLKWLFIPFSGLPVETHALMLDYPEIAVHNLHHNARPTAELALALLLAASKNLLHYDRELRNANWTPRYEGNPGILLDDLSVCIAGFGAVGKEVGRLCKCLDMEVTGIRASAKPGETWQGIPVLPSESLQDVLPDTQVLILSVPLTDRTRGLIGSRELNSLKKPAILINIARGEVVDEEALFQALVDGTLSAAGLDVWYSYPPDILSRSSTQPSKMKFSELSNVVMSPHRGGLCNQTEELRAAALARLIHAASRGESLWNRVELSRGY